MRSVTSPALDIIGLEVAYRDRRVLHGIDLTLDQGVTAVVGPSGCGKTTLLRTIAGFLPARSGTIEIAGHPVVTPTVSVPARRRGVGYVPQEGALFPHLTVAANVAFGLPRRQRHDPVRLREMMTLVDLPPDLLHRYPRELSGGQQQRVALARALAPTPALVLLDEPFSSLDAGLREETGRAVVAALRAAGASALMVTHDQGEALSLADQVAVMVDGRFLQVASPAAVYLSPATPEVASFIGHATLLPGTAHRPTEATCALGTFELTGPVAVGSVQVAVRAEQIQVRREADVRGDATEGGTVTGVVEHVSFYGHDAALAVRLPGGERLTARLPATDVPATGTRVRVEVVGPAVAFASTSDPPAAVTDQPTGPGHLGEEVPS